jgi:hypothetical protein
MARPASSCRPAFKDTVAVFVHDAHEISPAELACLPQFGSKELGLLYGFFRTRKFLSHFIGKDFRAVADMKKVSHGSVSAAGMKHVLAS